VQYLCRWVQGTQRAVLCGVGEFRRRQDVLSRFDRKLRAASRIRGENEPGRSRSSRSCEHPARQEGDNGGVAFERQAGADADTKCELNCPWTPCCWGCARSVGPALDGLDEVTRYLQEAKDRRAVFMELHSALRLATRRRARVADVPHPLFIKRNEERGIWKAAKRRASGTPIRLPTGGVRTIRGSSAIWKKPLGQSEGRPRLRVLSGFTTSG